MIELNRRALEVKIDGVVYSLKYPTVLQLKRLSEATKDLSADKSQEIDLIVDLLESLGLPRDVSFGLEPEGFQRIVEALSGAQKKI